MSDKNKNLDGIKKLSKEEREKSRNVVLASIGEGVAPPPRSGEETAGAQSRKVDGLLFREPKAKRGAGAAQSQAAALKTDRQATEQREEQKKRWRREAGEILPLAADGTSREKTGFIPDFKKEEVLPIKKEPKVKSGKVARQDKPAFEKKINTEPRAREDMAVQAGKRKGIINFITQQSGASKDKVSAGKQVETKKRAEQERARKEKLEKNKRKKEEERRWKARLRQQEKEKEHKKKIAVKKAKQVGRRRKIKEFKLKTRNFIKKFWQELKITSRRSAFILLIAFLSGLLLYVILLLAVLKFKVDSGPTRLIARYAPVPALITSAGVVEYYQYADLKSEFKESTKLIIARGIILSNLAARYNLPLQNLDINNAEFKKEIAAKIVYDTNVNQVAIKRINKIKQMFKKGDDFVRTANKYGDEQGQIDIIGNDEEVLKYGEEIKNLELNEISDIVVTIEGYYIFKCFNKTNKRTGLSYVMVRATILDKYLEEAVRDLKIWSLVD